ncbi:MAG: hypothetical protein AAF745_18715, partial [Planctomycetota bacterium]
MERGADASAVGVLLPTAAYADAITPIWDVEECEGEQEGAVCDAESGSKGTCVKTMCSQDDFGL